MKFIVVLLFLICACSNIERTTGKVLDNGNSAIRSDAKEVWWSDSGEPSVDEEEKTFEERNKAK